MKTKLLVAAVALLSSNAVFAANAGDVYAGASYGQHRVGVSIASLDVGVLTGYAGYQINNNIAFEGRVGTGIADEDFSDDGDKVSFGIDYTAQALAKASYDFNDVVSAYAIAGFAKTKYSAESVGTATKSQSGGTYGVGLQMAVGSNSSLQVEWQKLPKLKFDDEFSASASTISVGYTYRF